MNTALNHSVIHPSWLPLVETALDAMEPVYLAELSKNANWLPGPETIFAAFSQPFDQTTTLLIGESPYPRSESANGYAFWDAAVDSLWSETGLSKAVNRATSLRNFIKMLMVTAGHLTQTDTNQPAIAAVNKQGFIQTGEQLFRGLMAKGVVLLNASLVLSDKPVQQDANAWRPFMGSLLGQIYAKNPQIELLLMGNISKVILKLPEAGRFNHCISEHPYNVSFIQNKEIQRFFKPLALLQPL